MNAVAGASRGQGPGPQSGDMKPGMDEGGLKRPAIMAR